MLGWIKSTNDHWYADIVDGARIAITRPRFRKRIVAPRRWRIEVFGNPFIGDRDGYDAADVAMAAAEKCAARVVALAAPWARKAGRR